MEITTTLDNVSVHLSQEAFIDALLDNFDFVLSNPVLSPFCPGTPVDTKPPNPGLSPEEQEKATALLCSFVGLFNWLASATCLNLTTITNILSLHMKHAKFHHVNAAHYVLCYLCGCKQHGIYFSTFSDTDLAAYVNFPLDPPHLTAIAGANWCTQDASAPKQDPLPQLSLFASCSPFGFLLWFHGPIYWW
eukprot:417405-Ditylum_brightwellii.AAC.1